MLTIILDTLAAHLGPDYDPLEGADFDTIRRHLNALEMATADRLPPVTVADLKDDREIRRACEDWRDRRYGSPVDVTNLKEDDDGDTWTILRGSSRYEVREVARYEARPSTLHGSGFWYVRDNGRDAEETPDDELIREEGYDPAAEGFGREACERFARRFNELIGGPVWIVWDTDTDEAVSEDGNDLVPIYDCTDEGAALEAARLANVAHYQENAYGWPFAHNYAWEINERDADAFDKAGFVVATHEPSGATYAGIDGGGYSFLDQHWMPLYLEWASGPMSLGYVRTDKGLRRLAR